MEIKRRTAKLLVKRLSSDSEQTQIESLCELRLLSKHDHESRSLISDSGSIPLLTQFLYNSSTQENAIATLLNHSISSREPLMSTPASSTHSPTSSAPTPLRPPSKSPPPQYTASSCRVGVVEDPTTVVAQVAGCSESVDAFHKVADIEMLVDLVDMDYGLE
ncbi:uncharacterized protein LOC143852440 [Tasmannia lanceolata]|uniref:uncharacterized protein LOC143852440 n=1 Tax=Tasmannia lanceolata TaxID=3420 RepID=UPI0040641CE9